MPVLSKAQPRYLALLLLVLVVVSVTSLFSYPYVAALSSQGDAIAQKQKQIELYRQLASSEDVLRQELALLQRRNPAAGYYVAGETSALASASMQQYVKQIVDRNGGELTSTRVVQQDDNGAANSATLNVLLRTDMNTSTQILYLLESGKPLLFLDNLTINTRLVRGGGTSTTPLVALDISFDVTGYMQEGA